MRAVDRKHVLLGFLLGMGSLAGCSSDDGGPADAANADVEVLLDASGELGDSPDGDTDGESDDSMEPDAVSDIDELDGSTAPDAEGSGDVSEPDDTVDDVLDVDDTTDVGDDEDTAPDEDASEPGDTSAGPDVVDGGDASSSSDAVSAIRIFPTDDNPGVESPQCHLASPQAWDREGETELIIASGNQVRGLSPLTGEELWSVEMPAPEGEVALLVSTPVIVDDILVAAYAVNPAGDGPRGVGTRRLRHMVAVIDLVSMELDDEFEPLEIEGDFLANDGVSTIPFRPGNALNRATLAHARAGDDVLGRVFVTFGNVRDIQPWHGEAFEVSLDAWLEDGADAAITGTLITTPEVDCGRAGASGSAERICGGGLWAPGGHLLIQQDDTFELIMATGNGQLDVNRDDFANSILRVGPNMSFDHGCDPELCADFDSDEPSLDCIESCTDVFIHRFPDDDVRPAWGVTICDGLTFFECWGELDYTGGSTPILAELMSGTEVIVSTGKDGGLYLIDPVEMGVMHDRLQMTEPCGTETDRCVWNWAGTVVTTPVHTVIDGEDIILVPTFMPDATHSAGVIAVAVVEEEGVLRLEPRWQLPEAGSAEAVSWFRRHPSRLVLQTIEGRNLAWVVETARPGGIGNLIGLDLDDASIVVRQPLAGPGYRFTQPLVLDDRIYLPSCNSDDGPSTIEAYRVELGSDE